MWFLNGETTPFWKSNEHPNPVLGQPTIHPPLQIAQWAPMCRYLSIWLLFCIYTCCGFGAARVGLSRCLSVGDKN